MSEGLEQFAINTLQFNDEYPHSLYSRAVIKMPPGHQPLEVYQLRPGREHRRFCSTGHYCLRGYAEHNDLDPITCQALIYHYVEVTHRGIYPCNPSTIPTKPSHPTQSPPIARSPLKSSR